MANLQRVRVAIRGGGLVGPGTSTYYFTAGHTGFVADLKTLYDAVKGRLPSTTIYDVPNTGDLIDVDSGELVGSWSDGTAGSVLGTAVNQAPAGVGLRVVWNTNSVANGRRIRGSTFFVPLDATMYSPDGSLSASITDFQTAAATFVTSSGGNHVVYTRPVNGSGGGFASVISSTVPDKVTTLRSRRV